MNIKYSSIKLISILFVCCFALITACSSNNPENDNDTPLASPASDNHKGLLVKFKGNVNYTEQQTILNESGLTEVRDYSFSAGLIYAESNSRNSINDIITQLKSNENVVYAEPDYEIYLNKASSASDVIIRNKLAPHSIDSIEDSQMESEGDVSIIAILDTGIDISHKSLIQNMWVNVNEIPLNNIDDDHNGWIDDIYGWNFNADNNNPLDDNNHGTHVAGIVTGNFNDKSNPVSSSIKIVTLKVLDENGQGKISSVLGAFDYIVQHNIHISNNSWGVEEDSLALKDALQQLSKKNHLLIVAAGDNSSNIDETPFYPAAYSFSNILAISALNESGKVADYANFGNKSVHLGAYGSAVSSTAMNNSYTTLSGTSMASAFVSGIAVRVLNKYTQFNAQDIKNWLLNNAQQDSALKEFTITSSKLDNLKDILALISANSSAVQPQDDSSNITPQPSAGGSNSDNIPPEIEQPVDNKLIPLLLSASTTEVIIGKTIQLVIENGTAPFTWIIANMEIATISETGLLSAKTIGNTSVFLTDSSGLVSNEISITTTPMQILPENTSQLAVPQRLIINASGGTSPYTWSISDTSIAQIIVNPNDSAELEIFPLKTGFVTITLTDALGNISNVENVEINIPPLIVTPSAMVLNMGQILQLAVSGGSSPYTFTSQDETIASVDLAGFITAHSAGTGNIIITDADAQVNIVSIVVNPLLSISAVRNILAVNDTMKINANGNNGLVSWASSDSSILSVDSNGTATAHKPGLVKINAMDQTSRIGNLFMEVRQVQISTTIPRLIAGTPPIQLAATGGATPYSWSIDNASIATLTTEGLLTALSPGIVSINTTDADGFSANLNITVNASPLATNLSSLVIAIDSNTELLASGGDGKYNWFSANNNIATVDNTGVVNAIALGVTDITLSDSSGESKIISVKVQEIGLVVDNTNILITNPGIQVTASGGTAPYSWNVNNTTIASIDSNGFLTPGTLGTVTVSVTDANALSASIDITIDVEPLSISPSSVIMGVNQTMAFKATGGDNNFLWSSNDSNVLTVNELGVAQAWLVGSTNVLLSDGVGQTVSADVIIRELTISAPNTSITVGDEDMQLAVFGGKAPYTWTSSNNSVASISSDGLLTPVAAGSVTIMATDTDGISTNVTILVNDPALNVNTNNLILSPGETFSVDAQGGDANYSWSSSDAAIAAVDNNGLISALAAGTSTITLQDGLGRSINIYVEVRSIVINANTSILTLGQSITQLNASGGVAPYFWTSDNSTILVIDQSGTLLALNAGSANITVTDQDGFSASMIFTVNPALNVTQSNATLVIGGALTIIANGGSGPYIWSSNNPLIASVNSNGTINALATGNATITVTDDNGQSVQITVVVSSFSISASKTTLMLTDPALQIEANGGATPYNYSVNNATVAAIGATGLLTPKGTGTVVITVTDANNNVGTIAILIEVEPLAINTTNVLVGPGDSIQLNVSGGDKNYSWSTNNATVATVDNSGKISAINSGSTTIKVTDGVGQSINIDVEVRQLSINASTTNVTLGNTLLLTAVGGSAPYNWTSSNNAIASVNSNGLLTAKSAGSTNITVTDNDGFNTSLNITVSVTAMTIDKVSAILSISDNLQLSVAGGDGTYTWSSSNASVANVSNSGLVAANSVGISVITVVDGLGNSQNTVIEVRQVSLTSTANSLTVGESNLQINAIGGNAPYNWSSSNASIASVNLSGQVTAITAGSVVITATDINGFSADLSLSITNPIMTIEQSNYLVAVGETVQLNVTGGDAIYNWSSSDNNVASVSSSGLVTTIGAGTVTINVQDGLNSLLSVVIEVRKINLDVSSTQLVIGDADLQANASGGVAPYSWSSSNTSIANINNNGQISAIAPGNAIISVTDADGFSSNISILVSATPLSLNQPSGLLAINETMQLSADGGDFNYNWLSSNTTIASIDNNGLISAKAAGSVTITVSDGLGNSLSVSLEVRQVSLTASTTSIVVGSSSLLVNANGGNAPYTWSSGNNTIATVNSNGSVTAVSAGNTFITATDSDGFSDSISISVTVPNMTLSQTNALMGIGQSFDLTANGGDGNYIWSSSNNSIASVNSNGRVTANSRGNVTITVTDGLGTNRTASIEVRAVTLNAASSSITVGDPALQINASGGSAPYTWSSSNSSIANINTNGQLTAISSGSVIVRATDTDGFSGTISITINVAPVVGGGGGGHPGGGM